MTKLLRFPCKAFAIGVAVAGFPVLSRVDAQVVSTVREAEYRSRWQNYQVDLPRDVPLRELPPEAEGEEPKPRAKQSIRSFFQNGPVVLRAGIAGGWESSNEQRYTATGNSKESSLYAAPAVALFYDREVGPWQVSLRYSAGYVYYFTPDYIGGGKRGIQSQTAGADIHFRNSRLELRSNAAASYGSGYDIERSGQSDRLIFSELLAVDYQLAEFIRVGGNAGFGYALYPNDADGPEDSQSRFSSAFYGDYFWTGRTRLRLELGAGSENQSVGGGSVDRSYSQALFKVNYRVTGKLVLDAGLGVGYVEDSSGLDSGERGFRSIYTLALDYAPTEKTAIRLYMGLDGTSIRPEFSLAVNWRPRENTAAYLSLYQRTNLSTIVLAEDRTARGVMASVRQRLFNSVELNLAGGYEVESVDEGGSTTTGDDGFYFVTGSLAWQMNGWATWQLESRAASRRYQNSGDDSELQTRTAVSLRLTF